MPRPRFQFHLSTALALILVAILLLFLNVRDSKEPGWPLLLLPDDSVAISIASPRPIQITSLLLNILVALALLTVTAALSEFLNRRSSTPRHPSLTFPHPLALALALAEAALFVWFNSCSRIGSVMYWDHGIVKSHELYGWPYSFLKVIKLNQYFNRDVLLLNIAVFLLLFIPQFFLLNSLLRRTFHIHLSTTIVLMSASGLLIYCNLLLYPMHHLNYRTLLIRALLTLSALSITALYSEFIFKPDEEPPTEDTQSPQPK